MTHLLLIDDDKQLTAMLATYLEREGFEVTVVNDGQQGLNVALQHFKAVAASVGQTRLDADGSWR